MIAHNRTASRRQSKELIPTPPRSSPMLSSKAVLLLIMMDSFFNVDSSVTMKVGVRVP